MKRAFLLLEGVGVERGGMRRRPLGGGGGVWIWKRREEGGGDLGDSRCGLEVGSGSSACGEPCGVRVEAEVVVAGERGRAGPCWERVEVGLGRGFGFGKAREESVPSSRTSHDPGSPSSEHPPP